MAEVNNKYLDKVQAFANDLYDVLHNNNTTLSSKQAYFTKEYNTMYEYTNTLSAFIKDMEKYMGTENSASVDINMLNRATLVVQYLQTTISQFKDEMTIDKNVKVEDTVEVVNADEIKADLMNATDSVPTFPLIQPTVEDMSVYTHLFIENDRTYFITATDGKDLESKINELVDGKSWNDVKLYSLSLTEIPLQYKMILSI